MVKKHTIDDELADVRNRELVSQRSKKYKPSTVRVKNPNRVAAGKRVASQMIRDEKGLFVGKKVSKDGVVVSEKRIADVQSNDSNSYAIVESVPSKPASSVGTLTTIQSFLISGTETEQELEDLESSLSISFSTTNGWQESIRKQETETMIMELRNIQAERIGANVLQAWYHVTMEEKYERFDRKREIRGKEMDRIRRLQRHQNRVPVCRKSAS